MTEKLNVDLVIVGGGPAGMAAAVSAHESGIRDILILERDEALGGILRQCIHNGFGLHRFGEELTGPEYAYRYERQVRELEIPFMTETTVIDISESDETFAAADGERVGAKNEATDGKSSLGRRKIVTAMNKEHGVFFVSAKAVILAMGCRERPKGALGIAGTRPAGIYTAGTAQRFVNMKGYMPGRSVVILGSGDIGLIMARRMTLEGATVKAVCELMPYSGGLARNIEQCLNDFNIPLYLSHTVIEIHGKERVEGVTVAEVDEQKRPKMETCVYIPCDTLLLSCGLISENELTKGANIALDRVTGGAVVDGDRETEMAGVFACGNVLHVHDLVDYVSEESVIAGAAAARYIRGEKSSDVSVVLKADGRVRYTVPQRISDCRDTTVYFRVSDVYRDVKLVVRDSDGNTLIERKKQKLAPGEMETLKLTADMIRSADGKTITFGVE